MDKEIKYTRLFKVFLFLSSIYLLVLAILTYFTLYTGEPPNTQSENFLFYNQLLSYSNYTVFAILAVLANLIYKHNGKFRYLFISLLVLVFFTAMDHFYLREMYFEFRQSHGLWEGGFSINYISGALIIAGGFFAVVINYVVLRAFEEG